MPDGASVEDIKGQVARIAELVERVAQQLANSIGSEQGGKNMTAILQTSPTRPKRSTRRSGRTARS